jgi:hypothetical protein
VLRYKFAVGSPAGDDKSHDDKWIPGSVDGPATWAAYKKMLLHSKPTEKATKNLAAFLFCKLRAFF